MDMRGILALWVAGVLLTAGCGVDCDDPLAGTYLVTWVERSGTCGPIDASLQTFSGPQEGYWEGGGCVGTRALADDGCTLDYWSDCAVYADDGALIGGLHARGTLHRVEDGGDRLEGAADLTLDYLDGEVACHGLYDLTWTRP